MNSFLALAEQQIAAPRQVKKRDKALKDRDQQVAQWRAWRRERVDALLAGPYAPEAQALAQFLKTLNSAAALIKFVEPWRAADADARHVILGLIDLAIIELREKHGLPPFDDPLPGEPPNAFLIIREMLRT